MSDTARDCILCNRPPTYLGIFIPITGGPAVAYYICERCLSFPKAQDMVEAIIDANDHQGAVH